jgi:N-carbamoyl-L-amino-acid hydrolase
LPDRARIAERLERLWQISKGPGGGAHRPAFSAAEADAIRLVAGWAEQAGLDACLDRHGNLWGLPRNWNGALVSSGSHVDTVPDGGRYDGALGTVLGLELADELVGGTAAGARAALLVCVAEEAPRFGAGTIGSRLLAGTLEESALAGMHDAEGISAADARAEYRRTLADLPEVAAPVSRLRAHAEVHVAQRRSLRELGVVERVAAPRRFEIELRGVAAHSGEASMEDRRDALAAAAEVVSAVERAARDEPRQTVATVATLGVEPGALSVVPALARLGLDVRATESDSLERLEARIRGEVQRIAQQRGVQSDVRLLRGGQPVTLDPELVRAALQSAARHGISAVPTWSGAGHDAQHLSALAPTLLLFVPLEGGESHTPLEAADDLDIANAALIVSEVLNDR